MLCTSTWQKLWHFIYCGNISIRTFVFRYFILSKFLKTYFEHSLFRTKIVVLCEFEMKDFCCNYVLSSILSNGKCIIVFKRQVANIFNDFFHSVVAAIQSKSSFFCKSSKEYLPLKNYGSLSIIPTLEDEIEDIIFFCKQQ